MQILKGILIVIDIILAFSVIILVMLQRKDDQGLSGTITGAAANNFLDLNSNKNKGRTREGKLKRMTIILGIVFVIVTVALNIVYPLV